MMTLFNRRQTSEHALDELVKGLTAALGKKLVSVILFGSKVSGEFREDRSDGNVFLVLEDISGETMERLRAPIKAWMKTGHPMPVLVQGGELEAYAKSLPIEFLDMQDHHKVVFGDDPLLKLIVSRDRLKAQCAIELSIKLLKLRQAVILAGNKLERLRSILTDSLPSILTLYRAVLR